MQGVFPGNSVEIIAERPNQGAKYLIYKKKVTLRPTASTQAMAMRRAPTVQKTQSTGSLTSTPAPLGVSPPVSSPVSQSLPT